MSLQIETITSLLRDELLAGTFEPGTRLGEIALARRFDSSRTPVRLAMAALEREGLLVYEPNRGFRVRGFTIADVAAAIEVRGELEAMAARLAAERGITAEDENALEQELEQAERCMATGLVHENERVAWIEMNRAFHGRICEAAGNIPLKSAVEHICRIPMAGPEAIVFDATDSGRTRDQIRAAHLDHVRAFEAIRARQGTRAAAIMREHAFRSGQNKKDNFDAMKAAHIRPPVPGLRLVE